MVENVSPNDGPGEVNEKIGLWRRFGVPLVWALDRRKRILAAHAADGSGRVFGVGDVLDGGAVLPDFPLPLADLFPA